MKATQVSYCAEKSPLTIASRNYTEFELINALRNKEHHAFSYLYDHYAPGLNAIILRLVSKKELSEDILQEVFIKIWNNFDNYDESKGRLFTWLVSLTRNFAIDFLRSTTCKIRSKTIFNEYPVELPQHCEISKFDFLKLDRHILKLDAELLVILNLAYFNGMTQSEISKQLSMPLGSVKTKMRTAILQLRKKLA